MDKSWTLELKEIQHRLLNLNFKCLKHKLFNSTCFFWGYSLMVERLTFNQTVTGSTPVTLTTMKQHKMKNIFGNNFFKSKKYLLNTSTNRALKWSVFYYQFLNTLIYSSIDWVNLLNSSSLLKLMRPQAIEFWTLENNRKQSQTYWSHPYRRLNSKYFQEPSSTTSQDIQLTGPEFHWFKAYWSLHQSKSNMQFSVHPDFKLLFFVCFDRKGVYGVVGISKFYSRWKLAHNLILNLAFFNAKLHSFTNKVLIEESMIFNWRHSLLNYKLFKYTQSLMYLKDNPYGNDSRRLFIYWKKDLFDAVIVSDLKSHEKNVFFMRSNNVFTVGLVPANYRPWQVSFPIPLLADSILGQYHFLKSVLRAAGLAQHTRFLNYQTAWFSLKMSILMGRDLSIKSLCLTQKLLSGN